jgi:hypothetical protein
MKVKIILVVALLSVLVFWVERKHQRSLQEEEAKKHADSVRKDSLSKIAIAIPEGIVNYIDVNGKRQGLWEIPGAMKKNYAFSPNAIVEKGNYIDDKMDGEWTFYNPDGTVKEKRNYKAGEIVK